MTNIDSNEHDSLAINGLWEFELIKVSSGLDIDLLDDVGCLGHIKFQSVSDSDDLGWNVVVDHYVFDHLVIFLISKDEHGTKWVSEGTLWTSHHVGQNLLLDLNWITLVLKLDESWIFNVDHETGAGLFESLEDGISSVVVASTFTLWVLIEHNPVVVSEVDSLVNALLSQGVFTAVDHLSSVENLWSSKDGVLDTDWDLVNLEAPFLEGILTNQDLAHIFNLLHLVLW